MAEDRLIFPIGFDLEAAVKGAGEDWEKKYAERLENRIAKRPVNVKLKLDTSKLDSLDTVKRRLAELKIEPITPETKTAIKELARELNQLARAMEAVSKYTISRGAASPDAVRAARINDIDSRRDAKLATERERLRAATARAEQAELRLAEAKRRAAEAATRSSDSTRNLNREFKNQDGYVSRLIKRLAVYASFSAVGNFLTKVREVTAEFELQRVSLGAIIQDQTRANQLFSEIKAYALKSPVSIMDLTKYTKQLAAYKIGVDELFETTKKLTDVSVGLGVSMDRVVLAYGQTRATGYLRASEIRQFTEMGIPIVEELAAKLSKMNGEMVTAAQVMDMVSKRAISFDLVKQVFDDMTSAGGMFYQMQEKQGNTLFGMWAKMGDAASVMYDQIGNTGSVNAAMKFTIQAITDLMKHWRFWGKLIVWTSGLYIANVLAMKSLRTATLAYTATGKKLIAVKKANVAAAEAEVAATEKAGFMARWGAKVDLAVATAKLKAATATNVFSRSLYSLKAAFLSNPFGWVILAVSALVALFGNADDSLKQFNQSLGEINEKYTLKSLNDADNFKRLADGAVKAAEGSKEQREKLEELDRTYGEILGSENLRIEKLRAMNGEYKSLIDTINEYNIKMKYSEREGAIKEYYGEKKKASFADFEDELSTIGFFNNELGHVEGSRIALNVQTALIEELERNGKATAETATAILRTELTNAFVARGKSQADAERWANTIIGRLSSETEEFVGFLNEEKNAIDANSKKAEEEGGKLAQIYADIKRAKESLDAINYQDNNGKAMDTDTFLYQQMVINANMKKAADLIRNSQEMKEALGDKAKELEPEWLHLVDKVSKDDLLNVTTINFDALIEAIGDKHPDLKRRIQAVQKEWGNLAPSDATVLQIRNKLEEVSMSFDPTLQKMRRFLWDGQGTVDDYLKRLKEQQDELKQRLKEKEQTLLQWSALDWVKDGITKEQLQANIEEVKNEIAALDKLIPYVTAYTNPKEKKNSGGRKSDTRLQTLNEIEQTLTKINQKYDELAKKEGTTKALEHTKKLYSDTLAYVNKLGKQFNLNFEMPTQFTTLQDYRDKILKVIQRLKIEGKDKAALELQAKIDTAELDNAAKKIEQKLKDLSEKISRSKTAREFYDKILSQTGDVEMAANLTMSIYGTPGEDLKEQIAMQINELMQSGEGGIEIGLDVVGEGFEVNYKNLRKLTEEAYKAKKIGDDAYKQLLSIADNGEKDVTKMVEGWMKATEKAKTYTDKLLEASRTTRSEIEKIEAQRKTGNITDDYADSQIQGLKDKLAKEQTSLAYEAFKDSPMYVQMFDDLDNASTRMLENMKTRMETLKGEWKNLTPTQLKEMQSRLNEIDNQLAKRNPFSTLTKAIKKYRDYMKNGEADGGTKSAKDAEDKLTKASEVADKARKQYDDLIKKYGEGSEKSVQEVIDAKKKLDEAMEGEEAAQKAVENWKKVKDAIGLSANELFQMLNWAGDLAKGVADISEAMGADEEDVQYWNDMASALGEISGGIQDIVSAAMSGNVVGIISSAITAVPKMFVGFFNLSYIGRVKRANKEIRRQAELLEQLEYTYSRLEKAAEKAFGAEYIANYNKQLDVLNAKAAAYQKQLDAERSKGKKADKDKLKEYANSYRDTMDEIADTQGKLSEKFLGTDITSAARDFAKAWIDAYKQFGNTADAMSEKFKEMIQNMIVESLLARAMQKALEPVFAMIDNMEEADFYNPEFWKRVMAETDNSVRAMNSAGQAIMGLAESAGINLREDSGEMTGIKRDIASASEEQITGLAAVMNTWSYYVSFVPGISADVAAMRQLLEAGVSPTLAETGEWTDWQKQAMDNYIAIQRNTADTVTECSRIASACAEEVSLLKRVITNNPSATAYGVKVFA